MSYPEAVDALVRSAAASNIQISLTLPQGEDWAANPVTIGQDGVVHHARHGMGTWTYTRILADLPTFFLLLGEF